MPDGLLMSTAALRPHGRHGFGFILRGAEPPRCATPFQPHIRWMTELIVWHDGDCPLCRGEIAAMRRLDTRGAIRFVDAAQAGPESCPLDQREMLARFHASEDGRLLSGAAAFAAMWRAIPLLRPLGLIARVPVVLRLLESAYVAFLRVRPALQRVVRRVART